MARTAIGRKFTSFPLGEHFTIVPEYDVAPAGERTNLIMAAGAFGSGEHETSASCIEELEKIPDLQHARVLDLGSGTGILAIAALKLGAGSALCVDIEAKAVQTCARNCELNQVQDRVRHCCGTLEDVEGSETFDLIVANIYGDILIDIADILIQYARRGQPFCYREFCMNTTLMCASATNVWAAPCLKTGCWMNSAPYCFMPRRIIEK